MICNIYFYGELIIICRIDYLDFILVSLRNFGYNDDELFIEYDDCDINEEVED